MSDTQQAEPVVGEVWRHESTRRHFAVKDVSDQPATDGGTRRYVDLSGSGGHVLRVVEMERFLATYTREEE